MTCSCLYKHGNCTCRHRPDAVGYNAGCAVCVAEVIGKKIQYYKKDKICTPHPIYHRRISIRRRRYVNRRAIVYPRLLFIFWSRLSGLWLREHYGGLAPMFPDIMSYLVRPSPLARTRQIDWSLIQRHVALPKGWTRRSALEKVSRRRRGMMEVRHAP